MLGTRNLFAIALSVACAWAAGSRAGRPLTIDDADPVDPGIFEFESGVVYERADGAKHWYFPFGLTFGVIQNIEVGFAVNGHLEQQEDRLGAVHEDGMGDLEIGAKWRFMERGPWGTRNALVPTVKLPTGSEHKGLSSGELDFDLMWVTSKAFGSKTSGHINVGYTWVGGSDDDIVHGGAAMDYQLTGSLQWVGELFAEQSLSNDFDPIAACNTGLRWAVQENLILDAAVGTKIHGDAPDLMATTGLTFSF